MARVNIAHVSIVIAVLSLGAAMYQGWINSRNLEVVTRDIGRREHLRACKEVIEAYFEAKLRIARLAMPTMGAGEKRVVVKDNAPAVVQMMTATLSCDHRVLDGALGAELIQAFKGFIEQPFAMLV